MARMMKRALAARLMACSVTLAAASAANASTLDFTFEGGDSDGISFVVNAVTDPSEIRDPGKDFYSHFVSSNDSNTYYEGIFSNPAAADGHDLALFNQQGNVTYDYVGSALYNTGVPNAESNPTFNTGTFSLVNALTGSPTTLKISPSGPAPEVGVGPLSALVAGLGLFLARARRRKPARMPALA